MRAFYCHNYYYTNLKQIRWWFLELHPLLFPRNPTLCRLLIFHAGKRVYFIRWQPLTSLKLSVASWTPAVSAMERSDSLKNVGLVQKKGLCFGNDS